LPIIKEIFPLIFSLILSLLEIILLETRKIDVEFLSSPVTETLYTSLSYYYTAPDKSVRLLSNTLVFTPDNDFTSSPPKIDSPISNLPP